MSATESQTERRPPVLLAVLALHLVCLWPLLAPLPGGRALLVVLLAAGLLLATAGRRRLAALDLGLRRSDRAQRWLLLATSLVVTLGGLEHLAGGLTATGIAEPYSAMRTMLPAGVEDWRLAHLTADRYRQPDPELLWRPVAGPPYNRQRFKGPEIATDKPPGVHRLFCYGDSNTDGPPSGGWPALLGERLGGRADGQSYEVINAGVTGYSSYQGRLRFARDAARYRPDLVLVAFGWNDLAPALGAPDASFRPPAAFLMAVQRLLLEYDLFLVGRRYWPRRQQAPRPVGPRVSRDEYSANLAAIIDQAAELDARVVLLTRPHREPVPVLEGMRDNWRRGVPAYNRTVRRLAGRRGAVLVDVQRHFAERPELFVDECHFNPEGHRRMAALLERRLDRRGLLGAREAG